MNINITIYEGNNTLNVSDYTPTVTLTVVENLYQSGGGAVNSVNGKTGTVVLGANDINESSTRFWLTDVLKTAYDGAVSAIANMYTKSEVNTLLDNKMSSDLTDSHIFVGDATNKATDVEMTGDVTIDNTGATTLANTSVTAGTYGNSTNVPQIVVDSKGRITGASNVGVSISGALGYTPEDVSNKATSLTSPDNTKYPTTLATQTALDLKANISAQRSSAVIAFDTEANYGTIASPLTGNITGDYTGAIIGVVQLLIHNDSVAPTIPASWVKANTSASYTIGVVNFIAITWLSSNIATYTIWKSV